MKKETYIKMTQPFRDDSRMAKGLHIINRICTGSMYVMYPILLVYLFWQKDEGLLKALFVPAISFVILSVGRCVINRPRPYEKFGIAPVIPKDTKGKSFPSRHVFSAGVIAMTYLCVSPWMWLGIVLLLLAVLEAIVRVISGVHYISDVVAGVGFALIVSVVFLI